MFNHFSPKSVVIAFWSYSIIWLKFVAKELSEDGTWPMIPC